MPTRKIKWGILSTAKIGLEKVVPAMMQAHNIEVTAIASRNKASAKAAAQKLNIPNYYGNYEALLENPAIEAVYIPLPNHLHYEYTKKAIEHGKHVLCEKPMTLNKTEITDLIALRNQHKVKVGEAFMVRAHPQWVDVVNRIRAGEVGKMKAIQGFFSYYKTDPDNIRNILEYGGGGMWDIGCYPIHTSRWAFGEEPHRVLSLIDRDPQLKVDRLASVILDYPSGQCSFMVSTQLVAHQRMSFFGEKGKLEIEVPFNAPNDKKCKVFFDDGKLFDAEREVKFFDVCDQYTRQGEVFSEAIVSDSEVLVSLEDAYKNTSVIEAIFESEKINDWVNIGN